ncbi:hypothetical protein [Prescottella equi]|uniref:hypothetical protein n=1 Tax=Rhodococcus hoagii TaxID=43767 RepID=UPI0009C0E7EF|nr:hypothetical protein [Prescottella equi]
MTAIDWMPWQLDALDLAASSSLDISTPRQNGKSTIAREVARRAALRGENVLYLTDGRRLALDALHHIEVMQRDSDPSLIRRVIRGYPDRQIHIGAGSITFCSYRSERGPDNQDRVICDATPELAPEDTLIVTTGPLLRVGVQLERGLPRTEMIRYGMDRDDDPASEETWRKANPAIDTVIPIDTMRVLFDALTLDRFKADCLNAPR